ncbi:hypothetical protein ACNFU2_19910 [Chryseobacterium sp. PTM-20240506]|uniref:hypothetical protein n=1 Tax=Chryseobacterium sp. PTM-20240506 TaxID=3400631 RepID=UPI003AABDC9E
MGYRDKEKKVIAALWTEVCLAMLAIQAAGEGCDLFVVTDASRGTTLEAYENGNPKDDPIKWSVFGGEFQRDWARQNTVPQ